MTGCGDAVGVGGGHFAFMALKKAVYNNKISLGNEAQTALHLATASMLSGTAWQPAVNLMQANNVPFNAACLGVGAICTLAFGVGLRLGRVIYSPMLPGIAPGSRANLAKDWQLSFAVGGATACFVGTDISYGAANWLRPLVGVEPTMSLLEGCARAGLSTGMGFTVAQTVPNVVAPGKSLWLD